MPSDRTLAALCDIRDNVGLACQFTDGMTAETFEEDRRTVYAVTRCLEIISEASRRLPAELRDQHPDLPWREIMGAGNVYRHAYDNVAESLVWNTVKHDLPPLLAFAEKEIAKVQAAEPNT